LKSHTLSVAGSAIFWQAIQYGGDKVIYLLRLIILAKLLTPDDFGLVAIASVAIEVLIRISNFGMIPALIQREDATDEHYDVAWTIGVLRAITITVVVLLAADTIAYFFAEPRAANILRALAFRPLIDAASSIKVAGFNRKLNFRALTFMQLPKALINMIVPIILAPWLGVWALVIGTLVGQGFYLVLSYIFAPYRPRFSFQFSAIRSLAQFGRWVFWTSIIVMIGQSTLRLVISRQLGAAELGIYYLAASLAFLPTDIAGQIVGEVAFPYYSRLQSNLEQATEAFKAIILSLGIMLLPISALLISLAPSLVSEVLDERWAGSVVLIQILALANIIDIIGEIISPILKGIGYPDKLLFMESIQSLIMIVLVWSLTQSFGVLGAALAWIPAVAVAKMLGVYYLQKILEKPFANLGKPLWIVALVSLIGGLAAYGIDLLVPGLLGFILAGLLAAALMGGLLWLFEYKYGLGLLKGFIRAFPMIVPLLGLDKKIPGEAIS
jgi:O-antigen/teichoic acid export membrane protein